MQVLIVDASLAAQVVLHQVRDAVIEEVLQADDKLSFVLPYPAPPELLPGALLRVQDRIYRVMVVANVEDEQGLRTIAVEAWALWYDLAKMPELPAKEWIGATVAEILTWLMPGSTWSGTSTFATRRNLRWSGGVNRLECLREIERVFGVEISWNTVLKSFSISELMAADSGVFFLRGRNLRSAEAETRITDLVHRLYPHGYQGMTIAAANAGIPYLQVPDSPYNPPPSAVLVAEEFTDALELKSYAETVFAKINTPAISYRCGIADLSALPGYEIDAIKLGDTVTVFDDQSGINIKSRVVRIRRFLLEPWTNEVEISTVTPDIQELANRMQTFVESGRQGRVVVDKTGVLVFDAAEALRTHMGEFAPGRYGLRVVGKNAEVAIDEYGISPDFIKQFPNKISNSGFERYVPIFPALSFGRVGKPIDWVSTGYVTTSSNWEGTCALYLMPGEHAIQDGAKAADPDWWGAIQTRVSFHMRNTGLIRIRVRRTLTGIPYLLTAQDGTQATSLTYSTTEIWGGFDFSFMPVAGDGTVLVEIENIHPTQHAIVDAVQMEPDFTGRWPSFYTAGPNSVPIEDLAPFNTGLVRVDFYADGMITQYEDASSYRWAVTRDGTGRITRLHNLAHDRIIDITWSASNMPL